jgi:hypothetical protein
VYYPILTRSYLGDIIIISKGMEMYMEEQDKILLAMFIGTIILLLLVVITGRLP